MGIVIRPEERDHRNISRLTLTYSRGRLETPNRMVTKNDLNAKNGLGADVPLTSLRNLFICEEKINSDVLNNILNRNGYLAEFILKLEKSLGRIDNTGAMKAIFPKVTGSLMPSLLTDHNIKRRVVNFILQLMSEEAADFYLLQMELLDQHTFSYLNSLEVQYAPVLDIHSYDSVSSVLPYLVSLSTSNVPMIGLTYASYKNANLSYDFLMSSLESVHEANKAIITVGVPRVLGKNEYDRDVSAPHYSSFLVSDIVAEEYHSHFAGGNGPDGIKIFEKKDLAIPPVTQGHNLAEHSGEDTAFSSDQNLKDLFWRTLGASNTEEDIRRNRPGYISRIHETLETTKEYENMKRSIINHELLEYRRSKTRMNDLLNHQSREL